MPGAALLSISTHSPLIEVKRLVKPVVFRSGRDQIAANSGRTSDCQGAAFPSRRSISHAGGWSENPNGCNLGNGPRYQPQMSRISELGKQAASGSFIAYRLPAP